MPIDVCFEARVNTKELIEIIFFCFMASKMMRVRHRCEGVCNGGRELVARFRVLSDGVSLRVYLASFDDRSEIALVD